ncbi:exonuclease 3'-5' domain-containing protein 2-like [Macrosteles quadrilineatus]|uniref:exonuclease 3'-5' domain-containing protein 2-like n=1 Tax=Macrosteles quadrilineatus TaxID=74068 RepID=UPI0023E1C891|nr:exonuclease 3'-5' domain-containing protein 2-like [Macrosteles quadrilineatus]
MANQENTLRTQPPERSDIFMVNDEAHASIAVGKLIRHTQDDLKVFGVDCEWDLVSKKGQPHKPDVLQIATVDGFCAIFRLHLLKKVPQELKGFLEDPYYAKVGVGIIEDCDKLRTYFEVNTGCAIDVRFLADDHKILPRGLSHLTKSVLGVDLTKHHHSFHYWTGRLSAIQKQYAALDAIYPARLFYKLSHEKLLQLYENEWQTWSPEQYHQKSIGLWEKYVNVPFDFSKSNYVKSQVIDMMLAYADLSMKDVKDQAVVEEEPPTPPDFKARFASNKSALRKARQNDRAKRVPLRFFRAHVRRMMKQGLDLSTIPVDTIPRSMLGPDGQLDMERVKEELVEFN